MNSRPGWQTPPLKLSVLPENHAAHHEEVFEERAATEGGGSLFENESLNFDRMSPEDADDEERGPEYDTRNENLLDPKDKAEEECDERRGWLVKFISRRMVVSKKTWKEVQDWKKLQAQKLASLPENVEEQKQDGSPHRKGIFFTQLVPPYHPVCLTWLGFMLLFDLTYTAFWVPLDVGFCTTEDRSSITWENIGTSPCSVLDLAGGLVYTLNLILAFQWGAMIEYDSDDVEVLDGPLVAKMYMMHGRFIIDVLATVPFVYLLVILFSPTFGGSPASQWLVLLMLVRLLRLLRLVSLSKLVYLDVIPSKNDAKEGGFKLSVTGTYMMLLGYMLGVAINLEACIMLLIAHLEGIENSWLTALLWQDFTMATNAQQWYCSVYWVITTSTTTGYGDITPKSIPEQVFANIFMIMGLVFFGLLVGTISNATTRASGEAHMQYKFRKKISRVKEWLFEHNVPPGTRKDVQAYFTQVWAAREDMAMDAEVFSDLPHYLRQTIATYVMMDTVTSIRLFKGQEKGLAQLIAMHMRPVDVAPGSDLCQQGEEGERLWILVEGQVEARQHLEETLTLKAPCLIGDSVILADDIPSFRARVFTIRSLDSVVCKAWELRVGALWPIMRMYPNLRIDMMEHVRNRTLVLLAQGPVLPPRMSTEAAAGEEGGHGVGGNLYGNGPYTRKKEDMTGWCESSASISRVLLQRPQGIADICIDHLTKAKSTDGSLQTLLDVLLEASFTKAHKLGSMMEEAATPAKASQLLRSFTQGRPAGRSMSALSPSVFGSFAAQSGVMPPSPSALRQRQTSSSRMSNKSISSMSMGHQMTRQPAALLTKHGSLRSRSVERPATVVEGQVSLDPDAQDGDRDIREELQERRRQLPSEADMSGSFPPRVYSAAAAASNFMLPPNSGTHHGQSGGSPWGTHSGASSSFPPRPRRSEGSGGLGPSVGGVEGLQAGVKCAVCPTCTRPVCPSCGLSAVSAGSGAAGNGSGPSGWLSRGSQVSVNPSSSAGDTVRSALGLQPQQQQQHWRPTKLGRQTLFRISSLVDRGGPGLASNSIPVQEFGVGYSNFG